MEKNAIVKKERKAVEGLQRLGFSRMEAQVILFLFKKEGVTARDIEEGTKLRQPEVSQGTNALINRKWVKVSKIPTKGKGRPHFKYYLAKPKEYILNDIQRDVQKRIDAEEQSIALLRKLMKI